MAQELQKAIPVLRFPSTVSSASAFFAPSVASQGFTSVGAIGAAPAIGITAAGLGVGLAAPFIGLAVPAFLDALFGQSRSVAVDFLTGERKFFGDKSLVDRVDPAAARRQFVLSAGDTFSQSAKGTEARAVPIPGLSRERALQVGLGRLQRVLRGQGANPDLASRLIAETAQALGIANRPLDPPAPADELAGPLGASSRTAGEQGLARSFAPPDRPGQSRPVRSLSVPGGGATTAGRRLSRRPSFATSDRGLRPDEAGAAGASALEALRRRVLGDLADSLSPSTSTNATGPLGLLTTAPVRRQRLFGA